LIAVSAHQDFGAEMARTSRGAAPKSSENIAGTGTTPGTNLYTKCMEACRAGNEDELKKLIEERVDAILTANGLDSYHTLFLFDDRHSISDYHADRIYAAASHALIDPKNVLLIIHSKGGRIEPAYLISKSLKRLASEKFVVVVPRRAKSAATLIALGADEIHMGMMSQLGPIDPQFGGIPALALENAVNVVTKLACQYPDASQMLTNYLAQQIPLRLLGYYQRVTESAEQYAERLIGTKTLASGHTSKFVSNHLVHHYKDHSFVIDFDEAMGLLGPEIIRGKTPEYKAADEIFRFFDFIEIILSFENKHASVVGDVYNGIAIRTDPPDKSPAEKSRLDSE
jgi:hypothetical protein